MVRSFSRDHNRIDTFSPAASFAVALHGPHTSVQSVPTAALLQRKGAIIEALYRISEGFWFSPSQLVMDRFATLRGEGPPQGPGSERGYFPIDAEVNMPRLGASWVPGGATYKASVELSSRSYPVSGLCLCHSHFFYTRRRR